ncbi:hypothetical protein FLM9_13 [Candidatus Synechococcus spongiarum]|uniref:Uncharacterized protein n=1 Tax=Candidatus Synechococcus spongiarum TaxID=431041 RepID=A0A164Z2N0_9SYNE|nr:hypothetical protein FLM9_13 [Candidatus Synechococcus spongiarum]
MTMGAVRLRSLVLQLANGDGFSLSSRAMHPSPHHLGGALQRRGQPVGHCG